jgi:Protein of unknown function (DUF3301)
MNTVLFLMAIAFPAALFWSSNRGAAELAIRYGQRACERAQVQWLDQTAHMVGIKLRRKPSGWLGWERKFHFEYSPNGEDRYAGQVTLLGNQLVGLVGPMPVENENDQAHGRFH